MKSGTIILCPECKSPQMKTTKDLLPGMQFKDAGLESLGFDLKCERAGCHECSTKFVLPNPLTGRMQIHTDNGWIAFSHKPEEEVKIV